MADYTAKVRAGKLLTRDDVKSLTAVPHPNAHLEMMCRTVEHLAAHISNRPLTLVTLDQPLLVTGDEPVIVNVGPDHIQHKPDCFITRKELARRRREAGKGSGKTSGQVVHISHSPSGVADAIEIALPLSPRSILFLGAGGHGEPHASLRGAEAAHLASAVNQHVITQCLSWVAANPEHPFFADLEFPPPRPVDSRLRRRVRDERSAHERT